MDRILPFFDPPPLCGQFLYPEGGQKQTFLTPSPHLVHVVIERPLLLESMPQSLRHTDPVWQKLFQVKMALIFMIFTNLS